MGQISSPPTPDNSKWHEYTTVVSVRTNPTFYNVVELVVQDAQGKRATVRVQGAVVVAN